MRTKAPVFTRPEIPLWVKILVKPPAVDGIIESSVYEVAQVRKAEARSSLEVRIKNAKGKLVGLMKHEFIYCN